MIQRVQTIYLAIAFICMGVVPFFTPTGVNDDGAVTHFYQNFAHAALFSLSSILSLITIFLYKNRQNQFVLNRLNIISNFILLGLLTFRLLNLPGEVISSVKGIGVMLPIVSIVCLVLANKAIKRDEDLVKSVDRLR